MQRSCVCGTLASMPKKRTCPHCGSPGEFKRRTTTYPLTFAGGRQLHVARVPVHQCVSCTHLIPTSEGKEKLMRSAMQMAMMLGSMGQPQNSLTDLNLEHAAPAEGADRINPATLALRRIKRML